MGAQWLAWRLRLPSILVLLLTGLVAGPGLRLALGDDFPFLRPDELFGPLLQPFVSLGVCVILYEGGLSLRLEEVRQIGPVIRNLVTVGALVSWLLTALAARVFLDFAWGTSVLLGAILVVTGPTVIGPLLQQIRPQGPVGPILKWEGIVIDPIGAVLAVLVYEVAHLEAGASAMVGAATLTLVDGTVLGLLGAWVLVIGIERHILPERQENPASLALAVGVFTLANLIQDEAGLLAVTVMGVAMANQRRGKLTHIIEFKETLRFLFISVLFVVLAAKLELGPLRRLGPGALLFVAVLVLIVRPASVWISTLGSPLQRRERAFLALLAPRGIVAAAVSSQFALRLADGDHPHPDAENLATVTFLVIIVTVATYGLLAAPLARRLGLAQRRPDGILLVGAHDWAREIAQALRRHGLRVLLLDSNRSHVADARLAGLDAVEANVLSEFVVTELDLGGIGRMLALTPNDEVNALAAERFAEVLGPREVFQLPIPETHARHAVPSQLRQRFLFDPRATFRALQERFERGDVLKQSRLSPEFTFEHLKAHYGPAALPLFLVDNKKRVRVIVADARVQPAPGETVISLVPRELADTSQRVRTDLTQSSPDSRPPAGVAT